MNDVGIPFLIGLLKPEEFVKCQALEILDEHVNVLHGAYASLIDSDPKKLIALCEQEAFPLPEMQKSLRAYLKFYPDEKTGLAIYEKALLQNCAEKRYKTARVIANAMCFEEHESYLAIDGSFLFRALIKLSQL